MTKPSYKTLFLDRYLSKAIAVSGMESEYLHTIYKLSKDKIEVMPNVIDTRVSKIATRISKARVFDI